VKPFLSPALRAACLLGLAGCGGVQHTAAYKPKQREYAVSDAAQADQPTTQGSLWREGRNTSLLFTDARALRENDLVVVKVEEIADAKRSSDTDLSRKTTTAADISAFLNAAAAIPSVKFDAGSDASFQGLGSTARTEKLTATVPSLVRKVLPNGNLFIEGHRVVLVNSEEQHFYISGVVRPIDIDGDNTVSSTKVADAEIEFTGHGILTDNGRQGWAQKFWSWIWPF
jgi:flagellar L-ring protein precursor FlgH